MQGYSLLVPCWSRAPFLSGISNHPGTMLSWDNRNLEIFAYYQLSVHVFAGKSVQAWALERLSYRMAPACSECFCKLWIFDFLLGVWNFDGKCLHGQSSVKPRELSLNREMLHTCIDACCLLKKKKKKSKLFMSLPRSVRKHWTPVCGFLQTRPDSTSTFFSYWSSGISLLCHCSKS